MYFTFVLEVYSRTGVFLYLLLNKLVEIIDNGSSLVKKQKTKGMI